MVSRKKEITIAIVTRNRARDLVQCLESLAKQTVKPRLVIVIDNNSTDNTQQVISNFKSSLNIKRFVEKKVGYPFVYNLALRKTKTKWIAFIDDDCVANEKWFEYILKTVNQKENKDQPKKIAAILGSSKNYYSRNIFSCVSQYGNELWKKESIDSDGNIVDYCVLDSRNIIYNTSLLKQKKIVFDEQLTLGSEDSDLGLQIKNAGFLAIFSKEIIIYHKEPNSFSRLLRKKRAYSRSEKYYQNYKKTEKRKPIRVSLKDKFKIFLDVSQDLNFIKKILFCVCFLVLKIFNFVIWK